jgi:hypothetical protein
VLPSAWPLGLVPAAQADDGWKKVQTSGRVLGLDGQHHSASCSAYPGTDASYQFWARKGKSRNLVVYFEGGGACWNDLTCSFPGDRPAAARASTRRRYPPVPARPSSTASSTWRATTTR